MPTTITLTWPANPPNEAVQKYTVWESKNSAPFANIGDVTTNLNAPEKVINAPLPGNYVWKVTATNFVGTSGFSAESAGPTVPSAPGTITVTVTN